MFEKGGFELGFSQSYGHELNLILLLTESNLM